MKTRTDYHRLIVGQLCRFESGQYGQKLNEAVKVFKEFPDPELWDWLFINCKNFDIECPSWFLTNDGKIFLERKKKLMKHDFSTRLDKVELQEKKLGKDLKINKKKNILDFIKDGEE